MPYMYVQPRPDEIKMMVYGFVYSLAIKHGNVPHL